MILVNNGGSGQYSYHQLQHSAWNGWTLTDLLDGRVFQWSGDELADEGLFVALPPWGCHLLAMR